MSRSINEAEIKTWFFQDFFPAVCRTIYGSYDQTLDQVTAKVIYKHLATNFKDATQNDLKLSYELYRNHERHFTVTREVFCKPIEEYFQAKKLIEKKLQQIHKDKIEQEKEEKRKHEFFIQCKNLYNECLKNGRWIGTEFEANAIGRVFSGKLTSKETKKLCDDAKYEYSQKVAQNERNPSNFKIIPPWEKIYARMYVEEMVKRGVLFPE